MSGKTENRPLTYKISNWYGFIFSLFFLIYGGVKIVLSILDRNYNELGQPIIFVIIGLVLISFAFAYKELKSWGWYGLISINSLVILYAIVGFNQYENIILLIFSAVALYSLFASTTKEYIFKRH